MADINDLFDCFDDPIGFDNANETNNPIVIEEETIEKWVSLSQFDQNFAVICFHSFCFSNHNCYHIFLRKTIHIYDGEATHSGRWKWFRWGAAKKAKARRHSCYGVDSRWHLYRRDWDEDIGSRDWNPGSMYTWGSCVSRWAESSLRI